MHAVAVDWSGRVAGAGRYIWLAEATPDGRLTRLQNGRDRGQLGEALLAAALADPDLIVGLDFAFSFPLWFLDEQGLDSALDVPAALAESWLHACRAPFWGRPGRRRGPEPQFRETELDVRDRLGLHPKSIFQIGGAGAVGTGSLRGLPLLRRLRAEGFAIWPFDPPAKPLVVEIYPRRHTGPLRKSDPRARETYALTHALPAQAATTDDALDAAASALALLTDPLPTPPDIAAREGWIF